MSAMANVVHIHDSEFNDLRRLCMLWQQFGGIHSYTPDNNCWLFWTAVCGMVTFLKNAFLSVETVDNQTQQFSYLVIQNFGWKTKFRNELSRSKYIQKHLPLDIPATF
jgi:hypothetical protein